MGIALGLAVLGGMIGMALWLGRSDRRRGPETLFCPVHETVVEVRGDQCMAVADGHRLGSIWDCQRECRTLGPVPEASTPAA
jgi:hypothetical protein